MKILNVIVTDRGCGLVSINSFPIMDEKDADAIINKAQDLFVEMVVFNKLEEDEEGKLDITSEEADLIREDAAQFIDDGCYEINDDEETTVFLIYSDLD